MDKIEKGAKACYEKFNENLIGCCEPTWHEICQRDDGFKQQLIDAFKAGLEAYNNG